MQLGLHYFAESTPGEFTERRPGLDHVAFACASVTELLAWAERLDRLGVPHGEFLTEPYGSGLAFRDPDGIDATSGSDPPMTPHPRWNQRERTP